MVHIRFSSPILIATALLTVALRPANALDVVIDLSAQPAGTTITRPLRLATRTPISITLMNAHPPARYSLWLSIEGVQLAPISVAPIAVASNAGDIGDAISALAGPSPVSDSGYAAARSSAKYGAEIVSATDLVAFDTSSVCRFENVATLGPGEQLVIVVRRSAGSDGSARAAARAPEDAGAGARGAGTRDAGARAGAGEWTTILVAPARGVWRISLGFAFPIALNADREYATKRDTGGAYRINLANAAASTQAYPALFFHWLAAEDESDDWSWSLAGGLGLDLKSPLVMLGAALSFNQNITVVGGAMAHTVRRLSPQYSEGERVLEPLDESQLHRDVRVVNPFVSVAFRFSGNPFGR